MQYKTGSISLVNGNNQVSGSNTEWASYVEVGDAFKVKSENAIYSIAAVDSNTTITLTVNYAGTTGSNLEYQIASDFTPNLGLYESADGDRDWPYHMTVNTIRKLDTAIGQNLHTTSTPTVAGLTLDTYGLTIKDGIATPTVRSGYATIYVDTIDGDLKVMFGDGTIKTIVVDT